MEAMPQAVRTNFEEKVAYVAHVLPTMRVTQDKSFLAVDCGLPSDTYNVIVVRDLALPHQLLQAGIRPFLEQRFPAAIWYWDAGSFADVQALTALGLVHTETAVAMAADLSAAAFEATTPDGLTIVQATQADEVRQYGALLAGLFADTVEQHAVASYFQQLSTYPAQQFPALQHYIGSVGGEVVATGSLFVGSATCGIYDIVTRPDARQRGIGSAMFAHILRRARSYAHRSAVLQASEAGMGIYRKAGFIPVGQALVFDTRPLLATV